MEEFVTSSYNSLSLVTYAADVSFTEHNILFPAETAEWHVSELAPALSDSQKARIT